MLFKELEHKMKLVKQNIFECANKTGKWLAYKLCKAQAHKKITQLKLQDSSLSSNLLSTTIF